MSRFHFTFGDNRAAKPIPGYDLRFNPNEHPPTPSPQFINNEQHLCLGPCPLNKHRSNSAGLLQHVLHAQNWVQIILQIQSISLKSSTCFSGHVIWGFIGLDGHCTMPKVSTPPVSFYLGVLRRPHPHTWQTALGCRLPGKSFC